MSSETEQVSMTPNIQVDRLHYLVIRVVLYLLARAKRAKLPRHSGSVQEI
jgi:hypothetical protein